MKLYRGLKSSEFKLFDKNLAGWCDRTWNQILNRRAKGNFDYPAKLSDEITRLEKTNRLRRQHFTDNKEIAARYARESDGTLIEIDVPITEIVRSFGLEFQNFGKRKQRFEIVYVIDSQTLFKNSSKWKLKLTSHKRVGRTL